MCLNEVTERFKLLSGIDDEELLRWMPVIVEAVSYIKSLLKPNINGDEYSALLSSAAGTYAYYKWSLYHKSTDVKSFRAGDLTVTENNTSNSKDNSLLLWQQSLGEISHLIKDNSFFFEGVRV